jgi:hypothetical protein
MSVCKSLIQSLFFIWMRQLKLITLPMSIVFELRYEMYNVREKLALEPDQHQRDCRPR